MAITRWSRAKETRAGEIASLARRLRELGVPGFALATFDRDGIRSVAEAGLADVARGQKVTARTLFQAGSISKAVATVGALRLVEGGTLSLDEDVNRLLSEWKVPKSRYTRTEPVTLRRILTHSAGLTVHGFPGYRRGTRLPSVRQILEGVKPANTETIRVTYRPGTRVRYSGGGFVVLQYLMEQVTGTPFRDLMSRLVLRPAGMRSSGYHQPLPRRLWRRAARGYDDRRSVVKGGWHTYPELAPAGLWTTAPDLARLGTELLAEIAGRSSRILSPRMARLMVTPQIGDWGLGWGVRRQGRLTIFEHSGQNSGYRGHLAAVIGGPGIAVLTNSVPAGAELIQEILSSALSLSSVGR